MNKEKYFITILADEKWVIDYYSENEMPIPILVNKLVESNKDIKIVKTGVSDFSFTIESDDSKRLIENIYQLITEVFNVENPKNVFEVVVSNDLDNVNEETAPKKPETKTVEPSPELNNSTFIEKINKKLNELVGADEFKSLIKELINVSPIIVKKRVTEMFAFQSFLFSINDGHGLTTALSILAETVENCKLYQINSGDLKFIEIKVKDNLSNTDYYASLLQAIKECGNAVVCLDITDIMSKTQMPDVRTFIKFLKGENNQKLFVFRIPFIERSVIDKIISNLSDMLYIRTISFVPLTNNEIQICAKNLLQKNNFAITDEALNVFNKKIIEEKSDGRFYGVSTIYKVVSEIIYLKLLNDVKTKCDSDLIEANEISDLITDDFNNISLSGYEMLDKMIGMEKIKEKICEIVSQIKISEYSKHFEKPCIHMQFVGPPGTGKTTVARIIGKIFKEEGILSIGNFYEYGGRDLVGRYVGHTAPKTMQICRDAYGSVLFIDEAYSLYRGIDGGRDFGQEALDTLIAEMENSRDDLVVILAGYEDEMNVLMKGNVGLQSRIPYKIEFTSYSKVQLNDIYMKLIKENFKVEENFEKVVNDFFMNLPDTILKSKTFSNARYVRNLYERTWGKAALRSKINKDKDIIICIEDFKNASCDHDFMINDEKKKRLGFN